MNIDSFVLQDDGKIYVENELVGYLGWNENVLIDIHVDEEYRNQEIATAAVKEMVSRILNDGYSEITTTTVMNSAMEQVLQKYGCEPTIEQSPIMNDENLPKDVSVDDIPTEETIVWKYNPEFQTYIRFQTKFKV